MDRRSWNEEVDGERKVRQNAQVISLNEWTKHSEVFWVSPRQQRSKLRNSCIVRLLFLCTTCVCLFFNVHFVVHKWINLKYFEAFWLTKCNLILMILSSTLAVALYLGVIPSHSIFQTVSLALSVLSGKGRWNNKEP